jgi:drug/metabolite transporter (DMT)-like permease
VPQLAAIEDRRGTGIAMMLGAYAVFSCIDTSVKWLVGGGIPPLELSFMRYFGHFVFVLLVMAQQGVSLAELRIAPFGAVTIRALLLMGSTILNFIALQYLPLTLTSTILFSAPIIICVLSGPLLGERVGIWRFSAVIVGFLGILVAIRPFDESFHWAALLSLAGAACFALYSILTRQLAGKVSTTTQQFYAGAIPSVVLLPFAVAEWQWPTNAFDVGLFVMIGFFGWLGHQILVTAHRYAPAVVLTPYTYSFIIYLTLWSWLLFDQLPDRWTIAGAAIISAAGLFIWFRERRLGKVPLPRPET